MRTCGDGPSSAPRGALGEVAALFLDSGAWSVESLRVKLRKEIEDQLGASRAMSHAGTVEIPVRLFQSVGDAVVLSVPVDGFREALPGEGEHAALHGAERIHLSSRGSGYLTSSGAGRGGVAAGIATTLGFRADFHGRRLEPR